MSVLTTKQIMEIIPHRQPFLLIDTVEELESGMQTVKDKEISQTAYFSFKSLSMTFTISSNSFGS